MRIFRSRSLTKDSFKNNENCTISVEQAKYMSDNDFRKHFTHGILSGRNDTGNRQFGTSSAEYEFLNQCGKIDITIISDFAVLWCGNQYQGNDLMTFTRNERQD